MFHLFLLLVSSKTQKDQITHTSGEVTLTVEDSLFKEISFDGNGGAISLLKCTGTLSMTSVLFDTCTVTGEGGCIYIQSPTFGCVFTKTGSINCKASRFSHYAHLEYKGDIQNTLNSVTKCGSKDGSIVFKTKYVQTHTFSNINYSQAISAFKYALTFEGKCDFKLMNVQDNTCFNYLTVGSGLELTTANFINNSASNKHLLTVAQVSTLTNCFFKENYGNIWHYGLLTMDYCYLDGTEIKGKLNSFIRVNTNTNVFPTNFELYTDDGIESVPFEGTQEEATKYPDPTPLPTATFAPTPYPSASPEPEDTTPVENIDGLFTSALAINTGYINVKNALFIGLSSCAITCTNVIATLNLLEVTFYDIQGSTSKDYPGGAIKFEPADANSSSSYLNRICCVKARARNGAFGSIKPGTNADSHSNLTTIAYCTDKTTTECYNTVEFRNGNKVFDSWNSSSCYTTDTSGIFTMAYDTGHTSTIKYATFADNAATRAMVLNSEQETLTYSYLNIVNNSCSNQGALILMYDTTLYLHHSFIIKNAISYLLSKTKIGENQPTSTTSKFYITDCYVQSATWGVDPTSTEGTVITESVATRVLTHYAHVLCEVPVSKAPLQPEATYPTRCFNVQATEKKGVTKSKVTKVGMSLAPSVLGDYI